MTGFNRLTIVAAIEVIADFKAHSDMNVLEVQWDVEKYASTTSKAARIASWAKIATELDPQVMTEAGKMAFSRAVVELATQAPESSQGTPSWRKFAAGLKFDGFEIVKDLIPDPKGRQSIFSADPKKIEVLSLRRMLPDDLPGLDFREAESEVVTLLKKHRFTVAQGHLEQATSAFQRGEWAAANSQLRSFFEDYLNRVADELGFGEQNAVKDKREFLGKIDPPFLLTSYNEWNANNQKPQYVQGLWSRMHPEGSHPGLSEEEDATFRLQISLVTARLFLRRFDQRKSFA